MVGKKFKVVDLFAGPGGLAEGFASVKDADGKPVFEIACSVEKEASAFATLRLRAFTRQFTKPPAAYHKYLAKAISFEQMIERHPIEWQRACSEAFQLELGTVQAKAVLYPKLEQLRKQTKENLILVGGPPCQAYSLVGRARNIGTLGYDASLDQRHFLYKEYIEILRICRPVAFVMENVKGLLSASVSSSKIFERILSDLRDGGGNGNQYQLLALGGPIKQLRNDFVLRSEDFGVPQGRHRVIVVGVREDVKVDVEALGRLVESLRVGPKTVRSVLSSMPKLRSGLSKGDDNADIWRKTVLSSLKSAMEACRQNSTDLRPVRKQLAEAAMKLRGKSRVWPRSSTRHAEIEDNELRRWICDDRLSSLPNHETRGHMPADLARYAFASAFAHVHHRSPKAKDFPVKLAPKHRNWSSGKFADRFRVQHWGAPASTVTSHLSKDGHFFIHPDLEQCRSFTVREAARVQTFPDNYIFEGNRTQQFVQVGNAVPPLLAYKIALCIKALVVK